MIDKSGFTAIKTEMTNHDSFLLRLLAMSFFADLAKDLPWQILSLARILDLAISQGVDAIACDGLQVAYETIPEIAESLDRPENKSVKYDWFGQALSAEVKYDQQFKAAVELGALWASHGIRPVVMKGFAYARFYPIPQHRHCSDLDCYLFDRWEDGNALVEETGVEVRRGFYKNSSFTFKGLFVENHRFCSPVRGGKRRKEYELFLRELLENGPLSPLEGTDFLCPPPMFDAVFFMSHALNHFLNEGGIQLRHVCDWGMLMKAYTSVLDWDEFLANCDRFGLRKFAESMSRVARRVCGVEVPFECAGVACAEARGEASEAEFSSPSEAPLSDADRALLEEILNPTCVRVEFGKGWKTRWQLIRATLKSGWKFRLFSDRSMLSSLLGSAWAFLFEREPDVE